MAMTEICEIKRDDEHDEDDDDEDDDDDDDDDDNDDDDDDDNDDDDSMIMNFDNDHDMTNVSFKKIFQQKPSKINNLNGQGSSSHLGGLSLWRDSPMTFPAEHDGKQLLHSVRWRSTSSELRRLWPRGCSD